MRDASVLFFLSLIKNQRGAAIRASARMEFEAARTEYDPEIIARMLITGRQCVIDMRHKA